MEEKRPGLGHVISRSVEFLPPVPGLGPASRVGIVVIQSFEHQQCVGHNVKRWKYKEIKQRPTRSMSPPAWGRQTGKQYSLESVYNKGIHFNYSPFTESSSRMGPIALRSVLGTSSEL